MAKCNFPTCLGFLSLRERISVFLQLSLGYSAEDFPYQWSDTPSCGKDRHENAKLVTKPTQGKNFIVR